MNHEDFCSYELSKALKACGFDEPCDHYYTPNKAMRIVKDNALAPETANNRFLDEIADGCCTAVPLWHAQKWLRKVHKIDMDICLDDDTEEPYIVGIYKNKKCIVVHLELGFFDTYEKALSTGITNALKFIKNDK